MFAMVLSMANSQLAGTSSCITVLLIRRFFGQPSVFMRTGFERE
jgi:hypothetical protein